MQYEISFSNRFFKGINFPIHPVDDLFLHLSNTRSATMEDLLRFRVFLLCAPDLRSPFAASNSRVTPAALIGKHDRCHRAIRSPTHFSDPDRSGGIVITHGSRDLIKTFHEVALAEREKSDCPPQKARPDHNP